MTKHKCINGWTKERMLEVVRARRFDDRSMNHSRTACVYLNDEGNKCAIGLFIPDGHPGQQLNDCATVLFRQFPDLKHLMPLPVRYMDTLQRVHDSVGLPNFIPGGNAKSTMIDWIVDNVEDEG